MPLSFPSGAAASFSFGNTAFATLPVQNSGADVSIIFEVASWDDINNRILVAGDNDYVGSKQTAFAKLIQAPTLPPSPAAASISIIVNRNDSGVLYVDGAGNIFRGDINLDNWVDITIPAVTSTGCLMLAGDGNIYAAIGPLAGPVRDLAISGDNGATWDSNPGLNTPIATPFTWMITSPDRSIAAFGDSSNNVAVTSDPVAGVYQTFTMTGSLQPSFAAISDDNQKMVVAGLFGFVSIVEGGLITGNEFDIPVADNPFRQTGVSGVQINSVEYIAALGGFILIAVGNELVGFIDENNMRVIQQGVYFGTGPGLFASFTVNKLSAVDTAGNMIVFGTGNQSAVLVRLI